MGIPGLSKDLDRYGEPVILGQPAQQDSRPAVSSIIIDGPGLVYHVYHRLLACRSSKIDPLCAQPSCKEVSDGVFALLFELQERDIEIEHVYFDGALPVPKRPIRNERLERERSKLHAFHKSHDRSHRATRTSTTRKSVTALGLLDASKRLSPSLSNIPIPAFMVPAVIEKLKSLAEDRSTQLDRFSRETSRTLKSGTKAATLTSQIYIKVVAGEADEYCAALARETDAAILTNDSDLLIHDLGVNGSVIKLDTLQCVCRDEQGDGEEAAISGTQWWPRKIAQTLLLQDLSRLAYARKGDPYAPSSTILHRARQMLSKSDTESYARFMIEYTSASSVEEDPDLGNLDPRISELFVQFKHPGYLASSLHPASIYLPILIEDPTRTACWSYGQRFRGLAYSVLNLSTTEEHRQSRVIEHQRRGNRIAAVEVELYSIDVTIFELDGLAHLFQDSQTFMPSNKDRFAFWFVIGVLEVSRSLAANGKLPISQDWTIWFLSPGRAEAQITWDDLHALASVQAVLYSLRIIKQLLLALRGSVPARLQASVSQVGALLENLPSLSCLMSLSWEISRESSFNRETKKMVGGLYRLQSQGEP